MTSAIDFRKSTGHQCYQNQWPNLYRILWPNTRKHIKHQPCPLCGGKDRFRLYADWQETGGAICNHCGAGNGLTWVMRTLDCNAQSAHDFIAREIGVERGKTSYLQSVRETLNIKSCTKFSRQQRKANLEALLKQGQPLVTSQPAQRYLNARGLAVLLQRQDWPDILAISNLAYHDEERQIALPALIAAIRSPRGELVNVHRTYLSSEGGKATVSSPKKLMPSIEPGAMKGAAIRLYPAGPSLALTEGIETALAVRAAFPEMPVWACVSAYGLRHVILPAFVCRVFIMADKDLSGEGTRSASHLAARLVKEGRDVRLCLPPDPIPEGKKGVDWLDVLNESVEVAV